MFSEQELKERAHAYDKKRLAAKRASDPMTKIHARSDWLERQHEEGHLSDAEYKCLQAENWERC